MWDGWNSSRKVGKGKDMDKMYEILKQTNKTHPYPILDISARAIRQVTNRRQIGKNYSYVAMS